MLRNLNKIPILEIIFLCLLLGICFFYNIIFAFILGNVLFDENALTCRDFYASFKGFDLAICAPAIIQVIICLYVYLVLYKISLNKFLLRLVYKLKFYSLIRWIFYILLIFISPVFLIIILSFSYPLILLGVCCSLAFPLMLIYGYWGLEKYISGVWKRAYRIINILLTAAISFFTAGFVYFLNNQLSYGGTGALNVTLYIITVVTGVLLLLTNESKILLDKIKKYKWHCLSLWASVIYAVFWGLRNEWVNYYVIYISAVLLIMLVFEKPILRLKAKNTELRREAEVLYRR